MLLRRSALICLMAAAFLAAAGSISGHAQPVQPPKARGGSHVYLLRGFMNVFSYGIDDLAEKLQKRGVNATVHSYTDEPSLAAAAIQEYKTGRARTIIIIGHSMGAGAAVEMAEELNQARVPVSLVVTFDGAGGRTVPTNVKRLVNLYASNGLGAALNPPQNYRGTLINWQSKDPDMGHVGVAASPELHQRVIGYVLGAMGGQSASASPAPRTKGDAFKREMPAGETAVH
jgi:pimeloyl-ACP methyl ester carboxylesterase